MKTIFKLPGNFFFGNTMEILHDPLHFCRKLSERSEDLVTCKVGGGSAIIILNPKYLKNILIENNSNYIRTNFHKTVRNFLGNGLLTSEGQYWQQQRKIIQPSFHWQYLQKMVNVMKDETETKIVRLKKSADQIVNLSDTITDVMFQIVLRTLFGVEPGSYDSKIAKPLDDIMHFFFRYTQQKLKMPLWMPLPSHKLFKSSVTSLNEWVYKLIAERRKAPSPIPNLLDLLINIEDKDTGIKMNDEQVRDEVMTLVMAGHDTTASALCWISWLLASHPDVQSSVRAELCASQNVSATSQTELRSVIQEAMRLYPPAWIFARQAVNVDWLDGYEIPAKSHVIISPYIIHRLPGYWKDPEDFNPHRFHSNSPIDKMAYIPFGAGPRVCVGNRYAQMQMEIFLTVLLTNMKLSLMEPHVEANPFGTLKPKGGLMMKLTSIG